MEIKPIGNRVLLKLPQIETKTAGGIYIPEDSANEKKQGEIVALGNGKDLEELKVGDIVMYENYGGTEIKKENDKLLIVNFKDIIAIMR